jgi:uncharacterized membrane protein (DUF4010 family)
MTSPIFSIIPLDAFKILLVIFLSFLIGLEREEHKSVTGKYTFGGVRTYPLIGLVGYSMAFLSNNQLLPVAIGFAVIGSLMVISFWYKIQRSHQAGVTSELAGLTTYLVGALVFYEHFWVASTIVIVSLILLELKAVLEGLTQRFSQDDILTFAQFLFLTIVVLPILPNQGFSPFQINPFKTWLIVVAVSSISYSSFLLQRVIKGRGSVTLTAVLGGAYSSTVTTVALAKRSVSDRRPSLYAGGILMASGVMYLRLALLINLFNTNLANLLKLPFGILALVSIVGGWVWSLRSSQTAASTDTTEGYPTQNPLELRAALLFAILFVLMIVITHYTILYLGNGGIYTLASIMGVTDVDPFILGITQTAGHSTPQSVAAAAVVIAAASNNLVKGIYAFSFAERHTGRQSLVLLIAIALLGLIPLTLFH